MNAQLVAGFAGELVGPTDASYDDLRRGWNVMHDRRPAVIALCESADDVAAAIAHARANGLALAVRCGGHSHPGFSSCDDGLVVDLRRMNDVTVSQDKGSVKVQGGALLGDLDRATQEHGLVVPAGVVSHTGVGGLTLGGGVGRLMRRFGLTIDSLLSATIVTADGEVLTANDSSHPDLFWALRGGGGNFGVVVEFEFRTHPLSELVILALFHELSEAKAVLTEARRVMAPDAPYELAWASFLRKPPPLPWVPEDRKLENGILSVIEWSGDTEEGIRRLTELRAALPEGIGSLDVVPFVRAQTILDEDFGSGLQSYVKAGFCNDLSDELIDVMVSQGAKVGSDVTQIELLATGGAIAEVPVSATAFPHRSSTWLLNVPAHWRDPASTDYEVAFVRETFALLEPFMAGGAYSNFMQGDEQAKEDLAFGATLERLRKVKTHYDPGNVFRLNQNIVPSPL